MRTGGMGEYILSGAALLICSLVVLMQGPSGGRGGSGGFEAD